MLGALTPLSTIAVNYVLCGPAANYSIVELAAVGVACLGTLVCIQGAVKGFSWFPLVMSGVAIISRSAKSVWQAAAMRSGVSPGDLFTLSAFPMLGMLFILSYISEGVTPATIFFGDIMSGGSTRVFWVLCSALNATLLNFVGLFAIEIFGASVVHLIGNVKVKPPNFEKTFLMIWFDLLSIFHYFHYFFAIRGVFSPTWGHIFQFVLQCTDPTNNLGGILCIPRAD